MQQISYYEQSSTINALIEQARSFLPQAALFDLDHYHGVGEREIAFEYIMLEILERGIKINFDKEYLKNIALSMNMQNNEWNDHCFWEKFCDYLESHWRSNPSDFQSDIGFSRSTRMIVCILGKMRRPTGHQSHFSKDTDYGIFDRLSHDFSSSLPSCLGTEIPVQSATR